MDSPSIAHPEVPTKIDRLKKALLARLAVHEQDGTIPTSSRFLYYELEGWNDGYGILVSKVKTGARRTDQALIEALTALRESGDVPWDWIVDETRHVESLWRPKTVVEFLEGCLNQAKIDPWRFGKMRPFV